MKKRSSKSKEKALLKYEFNKLLKSRKTTFPKHGLWTKNEVTNKKGVYIIYKGEEIYHVGSTPRGKDGILGRMGDHLAGRSSFIKKALNGKGKSLRGKYQIKYLPVLKSRLRALLEHYAIGNLCPKHLGEG